MNQKQLAIILSHLQTAHKCLALEQYTLPGDTAADIIMTAYHFGDICDKTVADLGCGTGILGIGALLMGALSVTFVDCDRDALTLAQQNTHNATKGLKVGEQTFLCTTIQDVTLTVDTVVQNPPFGTKRKGADVQFLKKATEIAPVVYSLHKRKNTTFLAQKTPHTLTHVKEMRVPLFKTYPVHKKRVVTVDVELLRFER